MSQHSVDQDGLQDKVNSVRPCAGQMDAAARNLTDQGEPETGQDRHMNQHSVNQDGLQDEVNSVGPHAG